MTKKKQLFDNQDENIPYRFKLARESTGLKPIEFAKEAGLYPSQVYEVEGGTRNITPEMLLKIQDRFGINWKFIAKGEGMIGKSTNNLEEEAIHYGKPEKSLVSEMEYWKNRFLEVNDKYMALLEQVAAGKQPSDKPTRSA